ncbi:S-adenosylmethionine:tRNA ribosyltransferase-isomerase [Nocardioides anomalus]|uniref:S-adenosylmethionine:tRNA ribosyltransferase-isomerase n=1 Tax=Nocardioides anomalus TaxID=2712223 RepID=A0A6G6WL06_9ACTN|nr:S-adenosylmethionine:tRNA ribosyltransferase-isomerase [Nocardioides anomalus]
MHQARRFVLPPDSEARVPPEARGLARDEVRMAVVTADRTHHRRVRELADWLEPGDLLVVNTSATLPSALPGGVHVSAELDDGSWVVELRRPDGHGPRRGAAGEVVRLPDGVRLRLHAPHPAGQTRLWRATTLPVVDRVAYLRRHGEPIRYPYVDGAWPIEDLQNVYAAVPGSAEMPSAGRPLSRAVLVDLMAAGVVVAPLVLHTGVASQEAHEPPQAEWYDVPPATRGLVDLTLAQGGRVVAVGTTVVRALESAASGPPSGWTSLVLSSARPAQVVSGLLTGLHEPEASHLDLLEAVAGGALVDRAYADVTAPGAPHYLWHEFGDSMLLLPSEG